MVTVMSIKYCRGYTACDHLIDDTPLEGIVGESFSNVAAIRRAVKAIEEASPQDRRCRLAPVRVEIVVNDESHTRTMEL